MEGKKYDQEKADWSLVDLQIIEDMAMVLTYGAKKYSANNWMSVSKERYFAALMRHLTAYQNGNRMDEESGFNHLAHAMCNIYFLLHFDKRGETYEFGKTK